MNVTVGGTETGALALMGQLTSVAPLTAGLLQQASGVAGAGQTANGVASESIVSSALGFLSGNGLGRGKAWSPDRTRWGTLATNSASPAPAWARMSTASWPGFPAR